MHTKRLSFGFFFLFGFLCVFFPLFVFLFFSFIDLSVDFVHDKKVRECKDFEQKLSTFEGQLALQHFGFNNWSI